LINRDNPPDSRLLTTLLRPHGEGRNKRPIFPGSNNRAYQILATWVNSVCPAPEGNPAARPAGDRPAGDSGEVFAADRLPAGVQPRDRGPARQVPANPRVVAAPVSSNQGRSDPSYRYVTGQGMVSEQLLGADPREFPLPYMLGGPRPAALGGTDPRAAGTRAGVPAPRGSSWEGLPPLPGGPAAAPPEPARGTGPQRTPKAAPAESAAAEPSQATRPRKPLNLDPSLLQRVLNPTGSR
jgi:hypothetical protein